VSAVVHGSIERALRSRWLRAWLVASTLAKLALLASLLTHAAPSAADDATSAAQALAVERVAITVADAGAAAAFFENVLDFERVSELEVAGGDYERLEGVFNLRMRVLRMRLGSEEVDLVDYLAPASQPFPEGTRGNDRWFQHIAIVVSDMDRAYQRLREHRVQHASSGPQRLPDWNPNAGGIRAFYFRDPDGHFLELIQFPPGKGDPRWQRPGRQLFLGIDHTAIVVEDTERALAFYRDRLGLRIAGTSENYGVEQEHLNGVFGARLRITGLRAPAGPGVELLEYRTPRDGRPRPRGARASDLLHWTTQLRVRDLGALERALVASPGGLISPGSISFRNAELGFGRALTVADPDAHTLRLTSEAADQIGKP
jgi:catechol 2,3-dioxygenase-like lactoylglutathione lyase family enzyme